MSLENIKNAIPDYAKDIKLNISGLANEETLSAQQFWGCMLACAMTGGNEMVIREVLSEAATHLSNEAVTASNTAVS